MLNRRGKKVIFIAWLQILLLIGTSFYVSFIFSNYVGIVNADGFLDNARGPPSNTPIATQTPAAASAGVLTTQQQTAGWTLNKNVIVGPDGAQHLPGTLGINAEGTQTIIDGKGFAVAKDGVTTGELPAGTGPAANQGGLYGSIGKLFNGQAFGTASAGATGAGALLSGFLWGGIVYGAVTLLGNLFGFDKGTTHAVALAGFGGVTTWKTLSLLGSGPNPVLSASNPLVANAGLIGLGVGVAIFLLTYKKEKKEIVRFECLPWQP
ncbi:MAG: hypothetical protein AABY05_02055, partial [Nanoarchaeota archaeon]